MEIYTEPMKRIISKRINSWRDMIGHTVSAAYDFTNSDGNQHIGIVFEDGYWMLLEPVRSGDNDIEIEVIDNDQFWHYDLFLMSKFGICTEEEFIFERNAQSDVREREQFELQLSNTRKFLKNHPEVLDEYK